MTKHKWVEHDNCEVQYCSICDGGLNVCSVCGLTEGSLTTDCPGEQSWIEWNEKVYQGVADYLENSWVTSVSPWSPARYRGL